MVTGSKELIRDINSTLILESILKNETISRAAIAKELGLTKATVSAITLDLLDRGLIKEIGSADTSSGRKPILLQFDAEAGYIISIDLGVAVMSAARTDLLGGNMKLEQCNTPKEPAQIFERVCKLIDGRMEGAPSCRYGLAGIALAIHGSVKDNKITFAPYYDLVGMDFAGLLKDKYGVNVVLENEANLSALGEGTFSYDYPILANISVHSGIGLGLLNDHKIYEGFNGSAGEIGHTIVEIDGRPCPCGNRGCLEQYVSERVLFGEFAQRKGLDGVSPDEFFEYYVNKDEEAVKTVDKFVKYMAACVNDVINAFNPDVVVINSAFTANIPSIIKSIEGRLTSKLNRYNLIEASKLQDTSILLGGVCLASCAFTGVSKLR